MSLHVPLPDRRDLRTSLVLAATEPQHTLLLSPFLLNELRRVLRYERLRPVHGLDEAGMDLYVADLVAVAELVPLPDDLPVGVTPDPDDDPVVPQRSLVKRRCSARKIVIYIGRT